jgi:phage tail sheath protein FI
VFRLAVDAFARHDRKHGVHIPPCELELLVSARSIPAFGSELAFIANDIEADSLMRRGVNIIRADAKVSGRILIASAISAAIADEMRPLQSVRFLNYVKRLLSGMMAWTVFSPNDESTWRDIRFRLEQFFMGLWKAGVLRGEKPEEAFFVRCDERTMTNDDILNGRIIIMIGYALADSTLQIVLPRFRAKIPNNTL